MTQFAFPEWGTAKNQLAGLNDRPLNVSLIGQIICFFRGHGPASDVKTEYRNGVRGHCCCCHEPLGNFKLNIALYNAAVAGAEQRNTGIKRGT